MVCTTDMEQFTKMGSLFLKVILKMARDVEKVVNLMIMDYL